MNRITSPQDDAGIESIYRAAERKAAAIRGGFPTHARADGLKLIDEGRLTREVAIERERHLARKRFLPADLSSEWAWTILLDVFVNEQRASRVRLSDLALERGLSELTTARQVAALIEYGLLKRITDKNAMKESAFETTSIARNIIYNVINDFNKLVP